MKRVNLQTVVLAFLFLSFSVWADVRLDFNRSNQTYNWLTAIDYNIKRDGFGFQSKFNGESNLVKNPSNRWQENATAGFISEKSLLRNLDLVTSAQYGVSGLDRRRVRSSDLSSGISYCPFEPAEFRPMVRIERIRRSDLDRLKNDQGVGYGLDVSLEPTPVAFLNLTSDISFVNSKLSNIPSNELHGTANASARILGSDTLWLSVKGQEGAKKYYNPAGGATNIIKQIKQERQANFGAVLSLPAALKIRVDGNAHLSRYLYRQGMTDQLAAPQRDNYGRGGGYKVSLTGHRGEFTSASIGYAWTKSSQDFQGLVLDQDLEAGELSFHGTANLSRFDSLLADLVVGVTSYSNPNMGSNQQDRDQQTLVINGRYCHVLSRYFSLGVSGGVNSFHQIYVSGVQSANNGRNDTYMLTPFFRWIPIDRLLVNQSFDIQANYITFDFDRKQLATRNRIFRRASWQTDLKLLLTPRLTWQQTFLYRFEDYGQLLWNDGWQQAVSWDRKKGGLETRITYAPNRIVQFSPQFAWEKTGDYNHSVRFDGLNSEPEEIRYLAEEQVKLLFGIELVFDWDDARRLKIDASHRVREFKNRPREVSDYATLSLEYLF